MFYFDGSETMVGTTIKNILPVNICPLVFKKKIKGSLNNNKYVFLLFLPVVLCILLYLCI